MATAIDAKHKRVSSGKKKTSSKSNGVYKRKRNKKKKLRVINVLLVIAIIISLISVYSIVQTCIKSSWRHVSATVVGSAKTDWFIKPSRRYSITFTVNGYTYNGVVRASTMYQDSKQIPIIVNPQTMEPEYADSYASVVWLIVFNCIIWSILLANIHKRILTKKRNAYRKKITKR
jgi:hypothetical protein